MRLKCIKSCKTKNKINGFLPTGQINVHFNNKKRNKYTVKPHKFFYITLHYFIINICIHNHIIYLKI